MSERLRLSGLDRPESSRTRGPYSRADVIYAGGVILLAACERAAVQELIVSGRGVRWGALLDLAAGGPTPEEGSES